MQNAKTYSTQFPLRKPIIINKMNFGNEVHYEPHMKKGKTDQFLALEKNICSLIRLIAEVEKTY